MGEGEEYPVWRRRHACRRRSERLHRRGSGPAHHRPREYWGIDIEERTLVPADDAVVGSTRFAEWLLMTAATSWPTGPNTLGPRAAHRGSLGVGGPTRPATVRSNAERVMTVTFVRV